MIKALKENIVQKFRDGMDWLVEEIQKSSIALRDKAMQVVLIIFPLSYKKLNVIIMLAPL